MNTALKYYRKQALNKKQKTDERGHEVFYKKATGPGNIWLYDPLGYEILFEKFVKPSSPSSYILMDTPLPRYGKKMIYLYF